MNRLSQAIRSALLVLLAGLAALLIFWLNERVYGLAIAAIDETVAYREADILSSAVQGAASRPQLQQVGPSIQVTAERVEAQRQTLTRARSFSRLALTVLLALGLLAVLWAQRRIHDLKQQTIDLKRTLQDELEQLREEAGISTLMLTELTQHLLTAREDERGRLARNLHDELGALLTSAKLDAARIKSRLAGSAPEALERLAHLVHTLNASIALGRTIIEDLRPSTLSNLGLVPTLEILVREFAEAKGLQVHCDLHPVELASGTEIVVYRVLQEAITNISKYAQASQIWVEMRQEDGWVMVLMRDDGQGFDSAAKPRSAYGLLGMRVRVEAEGGRLSVVSQPGQGTVIQLFLPAIGTQG
ncbi:sensor histidine kinase [Paucibacter sp. Y2R2-4]|uniref:sensor histidine kinase n=1 Tax=Paucibacter sp. Y2R2-4 TaxID=2893553 RepID=UPI0021E4EE07|nr:sensor histidine kinase [Paucibacter sp. Y2R2-4]MCV2352244.1 sensor histidine kinase [Paucibacter sp. Y2R2-4]